MSLCESKPCEKRCPHRSLRQANQQVFLEGVAAGVAAAALLSCISLLPTGSISNDGKPFDWYLMLGTFHTKLSLAQPEHNLCRKL